VAIARDQLFIAFEPTLLEHVLRGGGQALADTPDFQAAAAHYPAESSTLSYQQSEQQAQTLYKMVKTGQLNKALSAKGDKGPDMSWLTKLIDPSKLPEFSVFAKYLAPAGGYGVADEDGITFTAFTLKKPEP
jgi:hypothetical protein